jgi:hypothetical protein
VDVGVSSLPLFDSESRLEREAHAFHLKYPAVYDVLVGLARQAKGRGVHRYGIGALWEVARWQYIVGWRSADRNGWKLNNNHRSWYARYIMQREQDLAGFFETRSTAAERAETLDELDAESAEAQGRD